MTFILNEAEIETAERRAAQDFHRPNLQSAVLTLARLKEWTNDNSDGWAHWPKPLAASKRLQILVSSRYFSPRSDNTDADVSAAELRAAFVPIRSFLTRHGAGREQVFPND